MIGLFACFARSYGTEHASSSLPAFFSNFLDGLSINISLPRGPETMEPVAMGPPLDGGRDEDDGGRCEEDERAVLEKGALLKKFGFRLLRR